MRTTRRPGDPLVVGTAVVAGLAAVAVAIAYLQPFGAAVVGSDSQSSVLYFTRIAGGELLERFLGTTPKPLLTLLYGPLQVLTDDWRPIAWLAIAAYGLAVLTTTLLLGRTHGPVAATFVAVGLIASPQLFLDVSLAYAVTWALLGVAVAGLCVTADRPRWALAALALAAAALARQEVFVLIGAALAAVALDWLRDVLRGSRRLPPAWPLVLALVALPLTGLHDWLLTGDPAYFLAVPALGAEGRDVATPREAAQTLWQSLVEQPALVLLALVGGLVALRARAWPFVIGLLVMGPGMAAFFIFVSLRGYVSLDRYLAPVDLAIVVAAAIGGAAVASRTAEGLAGRSSAASPGAGARSTPAWAGPIAALALAAVAPLVLGPGIGPLDSDIRAVHEANRSAVEDWVSMLPATRQTVAAAPALAGAVPPADPWSRDLAFPAFLVSAGLLPRSVVDLDLHLDRAGRLEVYGGTPDALAGTEGSLLSLSEDLSASRMETAWLLADPPVAPGVELVVLDARADRARLIRVDAAGGN